MAASTDQAYLAMEHSVRSRVPPILTDLYQFTMAYAYWRAGRHNEHAVFELFFRENPFDGGFSLFAGLTDCLLFLRNFHFSEEDIKYLQTVLPPDTDPTFFSFLTTLDCSAVSISSVPEGSTVFARVPLLEVSGPLAVVQLLETSLLCLVNYASLVCSNAARFRLAAGPKLKLIELGLRRAQGPDGGLSASRYSHIGGFDMTSNVMAGLLFGVPVSGTMAHSYVTSFSSLEEVWPRVMIPSDGGERVDVVTLTIGWLKRICQLLGVKSEHVHEGELTAFLSFGIAYPQNFLPVIDTYSVKSSGLPCFCAVALTLCELGYQPVGVRLDSGDLCKLSVEVRSVFLQCCNHFEVKQFLSLIIIGSNGVSEQSLGDLKKKLVEVSGQPKIKFTEDPEKTTLPGSKNVYRLLDTEGHPFLDLLCLSEEPPPVAGVSMQCHLLGHGNTLYCVTPGQVIKLRQNVFSKGQLTLPLSSVAESKARAQICIHSLHPRYKCLQQPDTYTVAMSEKLYLLLCDVKAKNTSANNFLLQ
ncbi:nicotinate phosphoribosyltransferase isoform X3 [Alosa alosa]|uniref:nicotinate phosphoribosyltransferase isoform X3 n=1 Tax=Alosa alosa TaxID=278164 RepID=UPI0020151083|nr:nicotinate phosphoribosyltransferase isoform X3 [Alosa alosa]